METGCIFNINVIYLIHLKGVGCGAYTSKVRVVSRVITRLGPNPQWGHPFFAPEFFKLVSGGIYYIPVC